MSLIQREWPMTQAEYQQVVAIMLTHPNANVRVAAIRRIPEWVAESRFTNNLRNSLAMHNELQALQDWILQWEQDVSPFLRRQLRDSQRRVASFADELQVYEEEAESDPLGSGRLTQTLMCALTDAADVAATDLITLMGDEDRQLGQAASAAMREALVVESATVVDAIVSRWLAETQRRAWLPLLTRQDTSPLRAALLDQASTVILGQLRVLAQVDALALASDDALRQAMEATNPERFAQVIEGMESRLSSYDSAGHVLMARDARADDAGDVDALNAVNRVWRGLLDDPDRKRAITQAGRDEAARQLALVMLSAWAGEPARLLAGKLVDQLLQSDTFQSRVGPNSMLPPSPDIMLAAVDASRDLLLAAFAGEAQAAWRDAEAGLVRELQAGGFRRQAVGPLAQALSKDFLAALCGQPGETCLDSSDCLADGQAGLQRALVNQLREHTNEALRLAEPIAEQLAAIGPGSTGSDGVSLLKQLELDAITMKDALNVAILEDISVDRAFLRERPADSARLNFPERLARARQGFAELSARWESLSLAQTRLSAHLIIFSPEATALISPVTELLRSLTATDALELAAAASYQNRLSTGFDGILRPSQRAESMWIESLAVFPLLLLLEDPVVAVRLEAVRALGELDDLRAASRLLEVGLSDPPEPDGEAATAAEAILCEPEQSFEAEAITSAVKLLVSYREQIKVRIERLRRIGEELPGQFDRERMAVLRARPENCLATETGASNATDSWWCLYERRKRHALGLFDATLQGDRRVNGAITIALLRGYVALDESEAIRHLENRAFRGSDRCVIEEAGMLLAGIQLSQNIENLVRLARTHPFQNVQLRALASLREMGPLHIVGDLIRLLESDQPRPVLKAALLAMGRCGDDEIVPWLLLRGPRFVSLGLEAELSQVLVELGVIQLDPGPTRAAASVSG